MLAILSVGFRIMAFFFLLLKSYQKKYESGTKVNLADDLQTKQKSRLSFFDKIKRDVDKLRLGRKQQRRPNTTTDANKDDNKPQTVAEKEEIQRPASSLLVRRVVDSESEVEKLKAELATKFNQIDELKKQLKNKQNLISRMKIHQIKVGKMLFHM